VAKPSSPDFYAILGVREDASGEQLREAYLRLAKKYHPDKNPDKPQFAELFKSISEAYAVLREAQTRARYDRLRKKFQKPKADVRPKTTVKPAPKPGPAAKGPAAGQSRTKSQTAETKAKAAEAQKTRSQTQTQAKTQAQAKNQANSQTGQGPKTGTASESSAESILENFLTQLFKTRTGRSALQKTQGDLSKEGLGVTIDRLSRHKVAGSPKGKKSLMHKVARALKEFFSPSGQSQTVYDVAHKLAVSPHFAKAGTTITISYLRDNNQNHSLEVNVPPGITDQTKLRMPGAGHLKPDRTRGDLILTVNIVS
jgi:curved DNA-binding protein CbpA